MCSTVKSFQSFKNQENLSSTMSELALKRIAENKARHARGEDARELNLGDYWITKLPDLSDMGWVVSINLSNNEIRNYDFLGDLPNLQFLNLSNNKIRNGDFLKGLTNLQSLNLSSNQISNGDFLKSLPNLQSLYLGSNQISNGDFLKGLTKLQTLNLSYNQISNGDFLKGLKKLQTLNLRNNKISNGDFLKGLTNLQSLNLSYNQIRNGDFLKELVNLQSLDLSFNKISNYDFLKGLTNLQTLNLRNNKISNGDFLKGLSNLQTLDLSVNQISNGDFLKGLSNLQTLNLSHNQISNYDFLKGLPNLQSLHLRRNQISDGDFLKGLSNLQTLDLRGNKISNGDFLKGLSNLQTLDLSSNKISDGDFLKGLTNLQALDLSYNQIRNYDFLKELSNLQTLDLSVNQISNGDFLKGLSNLKSLDLSFNQISDGDFLKGLSNLQSLDLSFNQISDGDFLRSLTNLQTLDLRSNQISSLEPCLLLIKKGVPVILDSDNYDGCINFYNNPLTNPPLEIVAQGNAAILRYFEELETTKAEDIRPLNEAKLIVIGQPRAGKTSLRYKLCDTERELPQQDESTRGIDIELQSFSYTDEAGAAQNFQYHIWDFGGQQIYHATHRFFLTKRTVYVAVVDTDVNDKQNDLDYWLHMIELMGDGSPVLLVQNQKNDRSIEVSDALRNRFRHILVAKDYELNLARLQQQKNPKFDTRRLADFKLFKKDIQRIFEQQAPILMSRFKNDTRQALERISKEKPVLELAEYRAVCAENGLEDPMAQMDLLRTLHNLGICLWYEGYDFLERIVILQNRWATDAVFKVLDNETVKKEKGHFRRSQLKQIWADKEYEGRVSELVALMRQFKLCYQIGETDEFIVPQLLDKNPPPDFSRDSIRRGGVRMVIEYEFMPRGIMTQFVVAMHRQISGGQRHAWETGFAVQTKHPPSAIGMAEESYDSRKLELWAKGPGAGLLLQQMLGELDKIHESFNRLRYTKLIPCNCERCGAPGATRIKEFDYDEILLEMYENRQPGIRCSYGNQTVPFEQLLGVLGFTPQQTERDFRRNERGHEQHFHLYAHDAMAHEKLDRLERSMETIEQNTFVIQSNQHVHTRLLQTALELAAAQRTLLDGIIEKVDALPASDHTDVARIDEFLQAQFGRLLERLPDEHTIVAAWKAANEAAPHETDMKWTLKVKIPLIFADIEKDLSWDGKKMLESIREEFQSYAKGERSFRELFWEG
jgi:internalin A